MRRYGVLIFVAVAIVVTIGFFRLRIEVDIFDLLPSDSLIAEGLSLYQNSFGASRELILSVQAPDADTAKTAARSLSESIDKRSLSPRVTWRNPLVGNSGDFAELLAYYWFNQTPKQFEGLAGRLQGEPLSQRLETTIERMATSYQPEEIGRLSYDPLGLSQLPSDISSSILRSNTDPFASDNGDFRILLIAPPFEDAGFWTYRRWMEQLQEAVDNWKVQNPQFDSLTVRITGTPAFISQTGSGLLNDMEMSAAGTLFLVAGLFWLVHRHWRPLVWLAALLVFILLTTVGLWGFFRGPIHAVSLGFAAILLGLAADYGLILYQEYSADPDRSVREHRAAIAPSIFWAATTTSAAFLIIGRSSLPGMQQLGILVGGGILVAAVIMMLLFLQPRSIRASAGKKKVRRIRLKMPAWALGHKAIWPITISIVSISIGILYTGLPSVDYSTQNLGPRENRVKAALEEVQRRIGGHNEALWVIVTGANYRQVGDLLDETARILDEAVKHDLLKSYMLPSVLWPHPEYQQENKENARRLIQRFPQIKKAVLEAGFTEDSLKLAEKVFDDWKRFAGQKGTVLPTQPGSRWVFSQFAGQTDGKRLALGQLKAAPGASKSALLNLSEKIHSETGGLMFGWPLLSESLMGLMGRDTARVLIPIGIVVLILLGFAFRNVGEISLSLATIALSVLCLLAVMAVFDWSWNLMNLMALPLLFGAGVDYSIHIQFALRRYGGELSAVRHTVGKAILLCGASTASGFGTLAFASNIGVAGLGRVCAVGILIIALSSVFLLPVWWKDLLKRTRS